MYDEIRREVDRLFAAEAPARFDELCINPVTGGRWVRGYDPIEDQKEEAYRALSARAWFAQVGPKDAPPLPLWGDRETKAGGGLSHIVALFAFSLWNACHFWTRDYRFDEHASFPDFARGVLASPDAPAILTQDEQLRKRYPPRHLPGLGPSLCWNPAR